MRFALAQINPTVGDLDGNARRIVEMVDRAVASGADLVVFPELCVTGYPPLDLLESAYFIERVEETLRDLLGRLPSGPGAPGVVVGAPIRNRGTVGKRLHNAALLIDRGEVAATVLKRLLPTYDVFDEFRYFEPGPTCGPVSFRGVRLGLHVCEDMWNNQELAPVHRYEANPIDDLARAGIDVYVNISASPFSLGKHARRTRVVAESCREHGKPFVLVNTVGANTEILFDGDSRVHAANGSVAVCAPSFEEHLLLWDFAGAAGPSVPPGEGGHRCVPVHEDTEDLREALVMGIRDYYRKTGIFSGAVLGLSGGIDSAVTAALAAEAIGPDQVLGVTMPSRYSSDGSVIDSERLAWNLGIRFDRIPIEPAVNAFEALLADSFAGTEFGVAEENIQSRTRGVVLMALANKRGYLLLSTGNKSELSVGYATLYGDMNGGLAVLADVLKTRVYDLARHLNERAGRDLIPETTLTKPPSAELRPDQTDQDSLPPYEALDRVLSLYVEEGLEWHAITDRTGFKPDMVRDILRMVDRT